MQQSSSAAAMDAQKRASTESTPVNQTLFQAFEWHTPGSHWTRLESHIASLAEIGITSVWLPPGCKANSPQGNGYDCYDLWDLGEFDQKWTRSTKWGSKDELVSLIHAAHRHGLSVIWDAVLNHKTAGDATEQCWAVEVDPADRRVETCPPYQIEPWIHYNFPGRGDNYSSLKWHWQHFNGTDWDQRGQRHAIFKIVNPPKLDMPTNHQPRRRSKDWSVDVDDENGNADYLMFSNIDYCNNEVRSDVLDWGRWMINDVDIDGFRLDAVQHYSWRFTKQWIEATKEAGLRRGRSIFVVGEFWIPDVKKLYAWIRRVGNGVHLFDVPLLNNFSRMRRMTNRWSRYQRLSQPSFDMRKIFEGSLVSLAPQNAVTMATNHDTQPGQAMETPIDPALKLHAYALILLRAEGIPCVFYGDLYGIQGPDPAPPACGGKLPALVLARKLYAYGEQRDYFDSPSSCAWTRRGTHDRPHGCAIIMSLGTSVTKKLYVGRDKAGQNWTDILSTAPQTAIIDKIGYGVFTCAPEDVAVYINAAAPSREKFDLKFDADIYR